MHKSRASCFTMIELLLVISIIMILTSILLPALNKARDNAKRIGCSSNLRQLGVAFGGYCSDYSGWFPRSWNGGSGEQWNSIQIIPSYCGIKTYPPVGTTGLVTLCPSTEKKGIWYNHMTSSYAMNYKINNSCYSMKINKVIRPSEKMLLGDSYGDSPVFGKTSDPVFFARFYHNNFTNLLFCDNHIECAKMPDLLNGECF